MIKLFDFQEKEIRTIQEDGRTWFSGQDVFNVLELTWKGASDMIKRSIPSDFICKKVISTRGGNQEMTFIDKEAVALICLQCRKLTIPKRNLFFKYLGIEESDLKINRPETIFINSLLTILRAFKVTYLLQYPVGKYNVDVYVPILGFIEYDEKSHSIGNNVIKDANREKEIQLIKNEPFFRCKQGEEDSFLEKIVIRLVAIRYSMSLTDSLVKDGWNHKEAATICKEKAEDLFAALIDGGISPSRLMNQ
jgi:hypothetical protein